jgi:hypothetical protein
MTVQVAQQSHTQPRAVVDLFGISLAVSGSFEPGNPLTIVARTQSVISVDMELTMTALDVAYDTSRVRQIDRWAGRTGASASERSGSVTFAQAGYYRVIVTARLRGNLPDSLRGREVAIARTETLWLLVDSPGGRQTAGFDESAIEGRYPQFGAYGPFRTIARSARARLKTGGVRAAGTAMTVGGTYQYYDDSDEPVAVNAWVPVKGGKVYADCFGRSSPMVIAPDVTLQVMSYVQLDGTWSVECPGAGAYEWDYASGNIYPVGSYADVRNHNNASVASGFLGYANDQLTIHAASNPQGYVLSVLEEYAPQAASRFGRLRGRLVVRVHDTDSSYAVRYEPCCDFVGTNLSRVYNTLGFFTTLHEYRHAFHYVAVEPWASYSISPPEHGWGEIENISGAFVEGFADFFAALIGESFTTYGNPGTDWNVEGTVYSNIMPDSASGWRMEGAIAGFLYDLVDSPSSPNAIDNTSDRVDDDSASYSPATVADVVANCSVNGGNRIDGIDQFIYCAGKSLTAQSLQHPTYSKYYFKLRRDTVVYSTVSAGSHSMSATTVRAVWLKNLFGL